MAVPARPRLALDHNFPEPLLDALGRFAIEGVGHDPLRATGALLLDLPGAIKRLDTRRPQVFWLRPRNPEPRNPNDLFDDVARHLHRTRDELWAQVKVSPGELRRPVLDD